MQICFKISQKLFDLNAGNVFVFCRFAFSALSSQKHFSVALLLIFGDRNTSVPHNDQNEFSPGEKNSNASLDAVSMN